MSSIFVGDQAENVCSVKRSDCSKKGERDRIKALRDFYTPKKNVLAKRFMFRNHRQKPGESFGDYIANLKRLACTCDFGASLEEQLRDQFVCGINNPELHQKLLNAASDDGLTWARMLEITNSFECTTSGMHFYNVLKYLEAHGLRLNKEKCSFFQNSVTYLGHVIDADGLS